MAIWLLTQIDRPVTSLTVGDLLVLIGLWLLGAALWFVAVAVQSYIELRSEKS